MQGSNKDPVEGVAQDAFGGAFRTRHCPSGHVTEAGPGFKGESFDPIAYPGKPRTSFDRALFTPNQRQQSFILEA
jgi:hypothetical protein